MGRPTCCTFEPDHWISWRHGLRAPELSQQTTSRVYRIAEGTMNLEDYVRHENIRRYRRILKTCKDETVRQTILELLTEEIGHRKRSTTDPR